MSDYIRFYDANTMERVNQILKVGVQRKNEENKPLLKWARPSDIPDDDYREMQKNLMVDGDGKMIAYPDSNRILQDLSSEQVMLLTQAYPSTTTVYEGVFANNGLERWKIANAVQAAIDMCRTDGLPSPGTKEELDFKEQAIGMASPPDAAEGGQRWHLAVELALRGEEIECLEEEELPIFYDIMHKIDEYVKEIPGDGDMDLERRFINHEYRYGGTCDLRKNNVVMDFKFSEKNDIFGKSGKFLSGKWCWPDRGLQLASYAYGLGIENPKLVNAFINYKTGDLHFYEYPAFDVWRYTVGWQSLIQTWYYVQIPNEAFWNYIEQQNNGQ